MEALMAPTLPSRILASPAPEGWTDLRAAAAAAVEANGLPTPRREDWRYTDPGFLRDWPAVPAGPARAEAAPFILPEAKGSRLVFVNGVLDPHQSAASALPAGVRLLPLAAATEMAPALGTLLPPGDPDLAFADLNTARFRDGALLLVPRGVQVEPVLHVLFLTAQEGEVPVVALPRLLVRLERGASATLVEEHAGTGRYLTAPVAEVHLGEDAHLRHDRVQRDGAEAVHVATLGARLERGARYECRTHTFGAAWSRQVPRVVLAAEGADLTLDGLALLGASQVADTHSLIDHASPQAQSRQLHKAIVDDRGRAVFNGRIVVRRDAQATDARQQARTLLLSTGARVDAKPQLEIEADDVKCAHGAAVGQLDPEELFYLQSRGLSLPEARNLLTYGFAADVLSRIPVPHLRRALRQAVLERTRTGDLETMA